LKVDYIIAGGQKCGTTALHTFLSKHPKVIVSNPKETDYFNYDHSFSKGTGYYHSFFKNRPLLASLRGFKYLETSPSYINGNLFSDTLVTANRIYDYNPDIKIICLVRNPIDRAYSAWNMFKHRHENSNKNWWIDWFSKRVETVMPKIKKRSKKSYQSFNFFINEEIEAINENIIIECPVLENGKYVDYLKDFKTVFGENLLIIQNENLNENTPSQLKFICEFLEIKPISWEFTKDKKIFTGNYDKNISVDTKRVLNKYYKEANKDLVEITGINYL
tara:strand:+ start:3332 stop:4159 length:828 start_codon:yes stop_codon:yes gene_type:complete